MQSAQDCQEADYVTLEGCWYALATRHQHEKMAADVLTKKGFEVFLPLYTATHRWKDRTKILSLPLYPSYVLLKGGLERRLQILTTPGVIGAVSFGGRPAIIPEAEIEAIRRVTESRLRAEPHPFLKCGEWVRVKAGPLEGVEGILIRKRNLYRLVLSVEILSRSVAVEVDSSLVEPFTKRGRIPSVSQQASLDEASRGFRSMYGTESFFHGSVCP